MGYRKKIAKLPNQEEQLPLPSITLRASIPKIVSHETKPYDFENCATKIASEHPPYRIYEDDVIAALRFTEANLFECSILLGRTRTAVRNFIFANLKTKDTYDEVRDILMDRVEAALFETALLTRDPATLRFLASTLGRDRGYTPEMKLAGSDGGPLQVSITLSDSSVVDKAVNAVDNAKIVERELTQLLLNFPMQKEQ